MKKLLTIIMVMSMCIFIISCSSKNNDEVIGVFSHENISLNEDFRFVSNIKLADKQVFLLGIHRNPDYSECAEIAKYEIESGSITYTRFDEVNSAIDFALHEDETILAFAKYNDETGEESYYLTKYIGDERMWEKPLNEIISTEEVYADDIHIESAQDKWYLAVGDTFAQLSDEGALNLSKKLPTDAEGLFSESGVVHVYGYQYHYTYDLSSHSLTESDKWKNALEEVKDKRIFI